LHRFQAGTGQLLYYFSELGKPTTLTPPWNAVAVAGTGAYGQKGKNCSYDPNILKYVEVIIDQN
jgi:hypothetical protein